MSDSPRAIRLRVDQISADSNGNLLLVLEGVQALQASLINALEIMSAAQTDLARQAQLRALADQLNAAAPPTIAAIGPEIQSRTL